MLVTENEELKRLLDGIQRGIVEGIAVTSTDLRRIEAAVERTARSLDAIREGLEACLEEMTRERRTTLQKEVPPLRG